MTADVHRPAVTARPSPIDAALEVLLRASGTSDGDAAADPAVQRAADQVRRLFHQLREVQEGMTEALITSQDRLLALRALTRTSVESLGDPAAADRVLAEALALTDSDLVVLLDHGTVHSSGERTELSDLVAVVEMVAQREVAAPVAVHRGRVVVAPLGREGGAGAVLGFLRSGGAVYSTGDLGLVEAVVVALDMMRTLDRLHREGIERATIEREHQLASSLAQAVLKVPLPTLPGVDLYAGTAPASLAGGDFFTVMDVRGVLWFAVGDVAGKGLPAAMVMTKAVSAARVAFLTHGSEDASGALSAVGDELFEYLQELGLFVTMALGAFHPDTGALFVCNAGHSPVLLRRGDSVQMLPATLPPLGVLRVPRCPGVFRRVLGTGDALVVGSDGLVEQENAAGTLLGYDRLTQLCRTAATDTAAGLAAEVLDAVAAHADGHPASDDRTLLVLVPLSERPAQDAR